jgi:hypothetical protein
MKERIDYLIKDSQCEEAIEDFKRLESVPLWLEQYSELFKSVSIKPEGLPRITSFNFDGESYENIQRFSCLYEIINSLFD